MPKGEQPNQAAVDFAEPHWKTRRGITFKGYVEAKVAQILHARELAKRLEGASVFVVLLHPGAGAHLSYIDTCYIFHRNLLFL